VTKDGRRRAGDLDTPQMILDVAERLVQTRGFNGFSYADVAAELKITKPALHYHFTNKADLGLALVSRYSERFEDALVGASGPDVDAAARLLAFTQLYVDVVREGRMCLCGMLAAEYQTLPHLVQEAVMGFFERNESWLADVLDRGRDDRSLHVGGPPAALAKFLIGELEGAMLVARLHDDPELFEAAARHILDSFMPPNSR
jgi:TetR/AcrR family transcriptional repressor of nem operon